MPRASQPRLWSHADRTMKLDRSMRPPAADVVFRSNDPQDPRIGDVLITTAHIPADAAVVCVLIGVPQDIGVERNGGRAGSASAPESIRRALTKMATGGLYPALSEGRLRIADAGDIDTDGKTLEQIHDALHDVVAEVLRAGYVPVVLGGGHDCAWPTIRAMETTRLPYGVINIDAHADVRPLKEGRAHSGSPFYQLLTMSESHLLPGGFVEFGLQHNSVAEAHLTFVRDAGMKVVMLDEVRHVGVPAAWDQAWSKCAASHRVYLSLDMDSFASAYAPGVSAPAADGFTPHDIGSLLFQSARSGSLAAFDVVECNPRFDVDGRTAKLAAAMIWNVFHGFASAHEPDHR